MANIGDKIYRTVQGVFYDQAGNQIILADNDQNTSAFEGTREEIFTVVAINGDGEPTLVAKSLGTSSTSISDGTDSLAINPDGSINVSAENPVITHFVAQVGTSGTGYSAFDDLLKIDFYDESKALTSTVWYNHNTSAVIPAPSPANLWSHAGALNFLTQQFNIPLSDFQTDVNDRLGGLNEAPYTSATGSVFAGLNSLLKGLNLRPTVGTQINFTSTTSAVIDGLNDNRKGLTITNEGAGDLYILLGSGTASITNYTTRIIPNGYYEIPFKYAGVITGIFASAGTARITLFT